MHNSGPSKTYTGTVEEVFSHRDEIPADAILELRVYSPDAHDDSHPDIGPVPSLFERYAHLIGTEHGLPPDLAERAEHYLTETGFGISESPRKPSE